ncbi:MAG: DUF4175 domain-containing protein [Saprospiraceae bacterium]|nr:DUF4175 domain-containing protein [Saprospiraceae bacterium]
MEWNQNFYDQMIQKLDQFTRKYYINKLIRGTIYFVGISTALFILFNLLESQFYFSKSIRKGFVFAFIGISGWSLWKFIFTPLLHYFRLGKLISHEEAAKIIGTHFSDVKDKLLNVLQLKNQLVSYSDRSLVEASINQKAAELKPVPFIAAIDFNKNRRQLRYALIPLSLLMGILFIAPSLIKDPTQRLIQNNKDFEKAAPFTFNIESKELVVEQFNDFKLDIAIQGTALPSEAFIEIDHFQYRLKQDAPDHFSYVFNNVQKDQTFRVYSGSITTTEQQLKVLLKPVMTRFEVSLEYPSYISKKNEKLINTGDLIIPIGTKVNWQLNTENTDESYFRFSDQINKTNISNRGEGEFQFSNRILSDIAYTLYLKNHNLPQFDTVQYHINVIPDQYAQINVESFEDSSNANILYFGGEASDDYGIRDLKFNYQVKTANGKQEAVQSEKVSIQTGKSTTFRYILDIQSLGLKPGDHLSYYFEVWDNDGIHGSKATRSTIYEHHVATNEELAKIEETNNDDIKKDLEASIQDAKKLQDKLNEFKDKLRSKKDLEWQNKKDLDKMLKQQEDLQKKFDEAKKKFDENLKKQEQHSNPEESLIDKQKQLQKLFNETMSEEMKKLMQDIQNLMQELNKEQAIQMTEQFQNKNEDMKKDMDRLLELFKQLEVEKNVKDQIDKLRELSKEQEALKEKTEKKSESQDKLKKEQEDINKKFDELKKKQDDIQKKNESLDKPKKLSDQKKNAEDVKKSLEKSKENLDKKENDAAAKEQEKAEDKMNEMADQMEEQLDKDEQEKQEEDIKVLRQLLENLVNLSFEQETLIKSFGQTDVNEPKYVALVQDEFRIKDNFRLIQDTLEALSKRVVEIESFVGEKVTEINENFTKGIEQLESRYTGQASLYQGRIMKNVNDLAVMLSETLNNKQKEKNSSCKKPGSGSCKKPGGKSPKAGKKGKVPIDKIAEGQQKMGDGLKQMQDKMKKGEGKMSKEFAEMAAKQAQLRKMLEDLEQEKKEQGNGSKEMQEAIENMNKTERELVNKQLTNETLNRQQEITTRLLEAERAEREREYKEERKSETGTKIERKIPVGLEEYLKQRQAETEWFQHVSPDLRPFYKKLVEDYLLRIKKQG